mgnify:CR=1 FL=1
MAQSVLSVRMDEKTKREFAGFCEEAGMSVSTAINLFARQTVRDRKMPFVISLCEDEERAKCVVGQDAIRSAVDAAARSFPAIKQVVLFGSYARGEARTDSDIDLRIEDRRFSIMNLAAFGNRIQQATGKSVDIVSKRVIDNDELREAIKRDGVVVYER